MCAAQLTERGHSCPLPPQCCFTASNILQEWQSDTVYSERLGNADVLVGSLGPEKPARTPAFPGGSCPRFEMHPIKKTPVGYTGVFFLKFTQPGK